MLDASAVALRTIRSLVFEAHNSDRYKTADCMLAESPDMSTEFFRSVCDAVHARGKNPTSLSTVYDVTTGDLYVYYLHDYEEVLVFNVYNELGKGEKYDSLPDYFRQTQAKYPIHGELVNPSSVTFLVEWKCPGL